MAFCGEILDGEKTPLLLDGTNVLVFHKNGLNLFCDESGIHDVDENFCVNQVV